MTTDVLHHDRYRVEQTLGTGAMGTVVLAHDIVLDRRVAVKVLADNLAAHDDFRQRFLREARLAARLCHPNIVQVFDAGENGRPFLVMEYVEEKRSPSALPAGWASPTTRCSHWPPTSRPGWPMRTPWGSFTATSSPTTCCSGPMA